MQQVEKLDAAIFERAAKIVRSGKTHPPLVIIETGKAGQPWQVIDVTGKMDDEAGKDSVAMLIDMLCLHPSVAIVAFVSEAWMVTDPKAMEQGVRPSQHPQRQECVVVSFSIGTGQRAINVHPIVRVPGKRPQLQRGTLSIEAGEAKLEGRFFAERRKTH